MWCNLDTHKCILSAPRLLYLESCLVDSACNESVWGAFTDPRGQAQVGQNPYREERKGSWRSYHASVLLTLSHNLLWAVEHCCDFGCHQCSLSHQSCLLRHHLLWNKATPGKDNSACEWLNSETSDPTVFLVLIHPWNKTSEFLRSWAHAMFNVNSVISALLVSFFDVLIPVFIFFFLWPGKSWGDSPGIT